MNVRSLALFGATNQVGREICRLAPTETSIRAFSRAPPPMDLNSSRVKWQALNLPQRPNLAPTTDTLIYSAPMRFLESVLDACPPSVAALAVVSSMSAVSKADSVSRDERLLSSQLHEGEQRAIAFATQRGISCTVLRPTMVYGLGLDQNVTAIAKFVQRRGFFVLPPSAGGLRQPVLAEDVAAAAIAGISRRFHGVVEIGGGERLPYDRMVERLFAASHRSQRIFRLPHRIVRWLARLMGGDPTLVDRIAADLVAENGVVESALGVHPRAFDPDLVIRQLERTAQNRMEAR